MKNTLEATTLLTKLICDFFYYAKETVDTFMSENKIGIGGINDAIQKFNLHLPSSIGMELHTFISVAKIHGDIERYSEAQYHIDVVLKFICNYLHVLFINQNTLEKNKKEILSINAGEGCAAREYLLFSLRREDELTTIIKNLENYFDEIVNIAKEIGFQVFSEEQYRYSYYRSLSILSRNEVYAYFQREGIPKAFLETK